MEKYNILITGATGFLGRHLIRYIFENDLPFNIFGLANSEKKISLFKRKRDIKIYKLNLTDANFYDRFDSILKINKIDYVIHSAAMKHVDICEENPVLALQTNTIASSQIVELCQINNVKNLICLSTDKSNTPFNVYGMSKNIMERIVLKANYSIYQGANFFGSDGSVIDIWFNQMCSKNPLTVTDLSHIRYFNDIDYIAKILLENLDSKGIILPKFVYKIQLDKLLKAFIKKFNYSEVKEIGKRNFEKAIEDLDPAINDIRELDLDGTVKLLDNLFESNSINISNL